MMIIIMGPRKKRNALISYRGQCDGTAWSNMAQKADSATWYDEPGNMVTLETGRSKFYSSITSSMDMRNAMKKSLLINCLVMKGDRL
jgi:hypothetical protein